MKIIILQFMAIIAMILISCNDKENSVYLKNGSYSECATGKNLTKAQEETAYVEVIIIKFTPIGDDANCLCGRQLTYEISNLQEGQSYDCVIMQENSEYASFKFDFTRDLTQTINLN